MNWYFGNLIMTPSNIKSTSQRNFCIENAPNKMYTKFLLRLQGRRIIVEKNYTIFTIIRLRDSAGFLQFVVVKTKTVLRTKFFATSFKSICFLFFAKKWDNTNLQILISCSFGFKVIAKKNSNSRKACSFHFLAFHAHFINHWAFF